MFRAGAERESAAGLYHRYGFIPLNDRGAIANTHTFVNRLDLADRELDDNIIGELWNGCLDRRVSRFLERPRSVYCADLCRSTVSMYHPDYTLSAWQLLLIFYACCLITFVICATCNKWLPSVDTAVAAWTAITIIVIMIALSVTAGAGRHSASYALGNYDTSFSGWGGFTFFIGLLPAAYCFSAIGMISSMAEECHDAPVKVPKAISLCVPVGGIAGLFFIIPICVTMPPLEDVIGAPGAQALPYIFNVVMGAPGGALGLMFLVLVLTLGCSISITVAASRCTWALARDNAVPGASIWVSANDHRRKIVLS